MIGPTVTSTVPQLDSESYSKLFSGTVSTSCGSMSADQLPVCPTKIPQRSLFRPESTLQPSALPASTLQPSTLASLASASILATSMSTLLGFVLSLRHFHYLSTMYSRPPVKLPFAATDHLLDFLSKPRPIKSNWQINLVCLQLTLKPPLILFLLMNQRPRLNP